MTKPKNPKSIDLREYEEEAIPFDEVIKRLARAKTPAQKAPAKKPAKRAAKAR